MGALADELTTADDASHAEARAVDAGDETNPATAIATNIRTRVALENDFMR